MEPAPPLRPAATVTGPWLPAHAAGVLACALGIIGFLTVALTATKFWSTPDHRITVPFFIATFLAGTVSVVRREGAIALPLLGIGLAVAAMVLGYFLITAAVVVGTALAILLMSQVM